jgi:hypothetical protein
MGANVNSAGTGLLFFFYICLRFRARASSAPDTRRHDAETITSATNQMPTHFRLTIIFHALCIQRILVARRQRDCLYYDISGRSNLWKVSANEGWPIQLAQSDDRQYSETWSPDGKWILFPAGHCRQRTNGTSSPFRAKAVKRST